MAGELRVRRCEPRDEDDFVRLNLEFMNEVQRGSAYWATMELPTVQQMAGVFNETLKMPDSMHIFVAELERKVVAYVNAYSAYSVWARGLVLTIDDLYVDANYRELGIGRAMMEHLESFAMTSGYKRVQLNTEMTNTAAQNLYLSLGYEGEDMRFFMKRPDRYAGE
jgi:ribosomal protein S18 acetylase RimI-like enzyme